MAALSTIEQEALAEFRAWLCERFPSRIREVVVFGSRARGEGSEDSDIDVLTVIDDLTAGEGREVAEYCGDLLTKHDVLISPFAVSTERMAQLRQRERRIAQEIDRDGVRL